MFSALPVHFLFVALSQRGLGLFLSQIKMLDYCGTASKPQWMPFFVVLNARTESYCNFSHRQNNPSILHIDYYTSASGRKYREFHWESDEADLHQTLTIYIYICLRSLNLQDLSAVSQWRNTQGDWLLWPISFDSTAVYWKPGKMDFPHG